MTVEKIFLTSNHHYQEGKLVVEIEPYHFHFNLDEFVAILNEIEYKTPVSYKDSLRIISTKSKISLNGIKDLYPIESYEINEALDSLFKSGKFI
ncbi:hypothetical protein LC574_34480 [Nostoc sp. CHAB 5715]|nr:hypothetical protein [Nostoc sp. CHAB 5715]